jgi:voltage-gated potassium channel
VAAMISDEVLTKDIVVVDENAAALERAKGAGLVTVRGDGTDSEVLRLASAQHADTIIVAANRDDTAVLVTLTARELAPRAKIIAAVREAENTHLLQQSGANTTVVTSETAGRLLGIAKRTPSVVEVIEDLLTPDAGFAIGERPVDTKDVGASPRHMRDIVLGVVRNGELFRVDAPEADALELGDRLLVVKTADSDR